MDSSGCRIKFQLNTFVCVKVQKCDSSESKMESEFRNMRGKRRPTSRTSSVQDVQRPGRPSAGRCQLQNLRDPSLEQVCEQMLLSSLTPAISVVRSSILPLRVDAQT